MNGCPCGGQFCWYNDCCPYQPDDEINYESGSQEAENLEQVVGFETIKIDKMWAVRNSLKIAGEKIAYNATIAVALSLVAIELAFYPFKLLYDKIKPDVERRSSIKDKLEKE